MAKRRTKYEMLQMEIECESYLHQTGNDYHKAYDLFIKDYLTSGKSLPDYIKGIKDFQKVSKQMETRINKDKINVSNNKERESTINQILSLSTNELVNIYKEYKNTVDKNDKIILVDLINIKSFDGSISRNDLNDRTVDLFKKILQDKAA